MLQQLVNCNLTLDDLNREFPSAKYIVLYRQSLAEQFISRTVAAATGEYLVRRGQKPRQAQVIVDPHDLRAYCDHTRSRYCDVVERPWLADKAVLLSYEELVADPTRWLRDHICPLLGASFVALETRLVKQSTQPLREQIVNYHEVAALLHSPLCRQQHHLCGQSTSHRVA
jgi:LPS sulfotransferase NodH